MIFAIWNYRIPGTRIRRTSSCEEDMLRFRPAGPRDLSLQRLWGPREH